MADALNEHVELLKRQYLQLVSPEELVLPPTTTFKTAETQTQIFHSLFRDGSLPFPPSDRYKSRVLKLLVSILETSISDPDEDEISDDLVALLAESLAQPMVSEIADAQRKRYVTYSAPAPLTGPAQTITTLETPALLAAGGTTGLRTWEAAKYLASFLYSSAGRPYVFGKQVIELGAGTGVVSMLCARHLGADFTLATDGTGEVVDSIVENMFLNDLDSKKNMEAVVLKWGHAVMPEVVLDEEGTRNYSLVLGADIIFDDRLIPPLVATLLELFHTYQQMKALIAATTRKEETLEKFVRHCTMRNLMIKTVSSSASNPIEPQTGLFYSRNSDITIFEITKAFPV